jgi:Cft2 family RNA processing exonuclease
VKLTFYGAAGEVTGSCFLLEVGNHRLLSYCALIQDRRQEEARKAGFRGPIYTHAATRDLGRILPQDAGFLEGIDAQWENRKHERKGLTPVSALYTRRVAIAVWGGLADQHLLPNLRFRASTEESMALNRIRSGAIIIAGSGMCTGGRIEHHLKHNAWRSRCQMLMVGYQARASPGRALVDGARHLRLWGETVRVATQVHTVGGLSAHAGRSDMVDWYSAIPGSPPLWLVHGGGRRAPRWPGPRARATRCK